MFLLPCHEFYLCVLNSHTHHASGMCAFVFCTLYSQNSLTMFHVTISDASALEPMYHVLTVAALCLQPAVRFHHSSRVLDRQDGPRWAERQNTTETGGRLQNHYPQGKATSSLWTITWTMNMHGLNNSIFTVVWNFHFRFRSWNMK